MAHIATSSNAYSVLAKSDPAQVEPGKGTSKKARKRHRKAAQKASASTTTKEETFKPQERAGQTNTANITPTKPAFAGAKVLRLTDVDVAVKQSGSSAKSGPPLTKSVSAAVALGHQIKSPSDLAKPGESYSAVASAAQQTPSSPIVPGADRDEPKLSKSSRSSSQWPPSNHFDVLKDTNSVDPIAPTGKPKGVKDKLKGSKSEKKTGSQGGPSFAAPALTSGNDASRLSASACSEGCEPSKASSKLMLVGSAKAEVQPVPTASDIRNMEPTKAPNALGKSPTAAAGFSTRNARAWAAVSIPKQIGQRTSTMSRSENATTPTVSKNPAAPAPTGPEKKRTEVTAPAILSPTPSQTTASPSASDNPVTQSPSALKFPGSVETIKITTAEPMKQQAKKARTQSPVVEQEVDDLLQMSRPHRQTLFEGPQMVIYVGEKSVPNVAKRAAMAASRMLNDHFRKKPESLEYSFEAGFVDLAAIRTLLVTWPLQSSKEFQAGEVPFQDTFEENMALLRAARFLGMERYTKTILKYHLDYLKTSLPEYSEIDTVERMATSDKDPLWTSMVNHLTHSRFKGFIPDPEEFAAFLDKHPKLKAAMEAADEFFKNSAAKEREKKDQRRPAEQKAGENARHQRWQKNKKRRERESATAESL